MPPVGTDMGTYQLGGITVTCREGRCETPDGVLAGSVLDMASAIRNAVQSLGVPLDEAARMGSTYPAQFLGVADVRGAIAPGMRADFVTLGDDLTVRQTWIGARLQ
jgi:N-acetylglucosamine-6-phosphate deacetylase